MLRIAAMAPGYHTASDVAPRRGGNLEARRLEELLPRGAREHTQDVAIVHDATVALVVSQHDGVVHRVGRSGRISVVRPLEVAKRASVAVGATVVGSRPERLLHAVGRKDREATGSAVGSGGFHRRRKIRLPGQVVDGIVNEDSVEGSFEPNRPHVALSVLTLRIERPAHVQHLRGDVHEGELVVGLQVAGVVAAAGTELEKRPDGAGRVLLEEPANVRRLLGIVLAGR
jgi:hypothetical protein